MGGTTERPSSIRAKKKMFLYKQNRKKKKAAAAVAGSDRSSPRRRRARARLSGLPSPEEDVEVLLGGEQSFV